MSCSSSTRCRTLALVAALASPTLAHAADADDAQLVRDAHDALSRNEPTAALVALETLADRGVVHPDVSFDRGLAYAARARSDRAEPGDLGRAAAGFEEALRLRPSDEEARRALDAVRAAVVKRRARLDLPEVIVRPSLERAFARWLSPKGWLRLGAAASVLLAIGIALRGLSAGNTNDADVPGDPSAQASRARIAGGVATTLAVIALCVVVPSALFSRWLVTARREAVVVAPEITLVDARAKPIAAPTIPEAALVELGPRRGDEVLVRWGSYEGLAPSDSVRALAP
jgi:hypothetical protein